MTSSLSREEVRIIADAPGIARTAEGPLASAELFVMVNLPKRTTGTDANVPFRGVERAALAVRGDIEFIEGRNFQSGRNEIIAGAASAPPDRSAESISTTPSASGKTRGRSSASIPAAVDQPSPKYGPTRPSSSLRSSAATRSNRSSSSSLRPAPSGTSRTR
jgi:hypothetical protein